MEEQLATGWGFNQLWLGPLGGDFESVNTQFPPGGFGSTNGFPPTVSVFLPGDFVKSPPVNVHVENSLSEFEWENVFSPDSFDPTNVDNAEDFQLSREESNLQCSSITHELECAIDSRVTVTLLSMNVQCSDEYA